MHTSARGIDLIKGFEAFGLPGKPGEAYQDSVGVWTIGYGHTAAAGPPAPTRGMKITEAEGTALLARDLATTEEGVTRLCTRVPTQAQFDALVSFAFNEGVGALHGSSVLRFFNQGLILQAADAFLLWDKVKNKRTGTLIESEGLKHRREKERALFLSTGVTVPRPVTVPLAEDVPVVAASLSLWARFKLWFFGA